MYVAFWLLQTSWEYSFGSPPASLLICSSSPFWLLQCSSGYLIFVSKWGIKMKMGVGKLDFGDGTNWKNFVFCFLCSCFLSYFCWLLNIFYCPLSLSINKTLWNHARLILTFHLGHLGHSTAYSKSKDKKCCRFKHIHDMHMVPRGFSKDPIFRYRSN